MYMYIKFLNYLDVCYDLLYDEQEFVKYVTTMLQGKTEKQAESWIKYHKIPHEMSLRIMHYVRLKMREGEDVDVRNLLCILPPMLRNLVKKHLCFPIVKKASTFLLSLIFVVYIYLFIVRCNNCE